MAETPRYEDITETTGGALTTEAASMMYTRYAMAARASRGRRVLELGCGAGLGLGLMARDARLAVGGDYSAALLRSGTRHYGGRVPFARLSAEALPFPAHSFDVVCFFEATYYIPDMEKAFDEIARILAPGGEVLFVNANPERPDFVRSPFSVRYHTAAEFRAALERRGFRVSTSAAFPVQDQGKPSLLGTVLPVARRILERLHLVPTTLEGRARLKRILFGKLRQIPPEVAPDFAPEVIPVETGPGPVRNYKVIYVRGVRG
ncbi:MAG: class I SAM-dependent methyltransferase [Gemmatimonadales bacterium]